MFSFNSFFFFMTPLFIHSLLVLLEIHCQAAARGQTRHMTRVHVVLLTEEIKLLKCSFLCFLCTFPLLFQVCSLTIGEDPNMHVYIYIYITRTAVVHTDVKFKKKKHLICFQEYILDPVANNVHSGGKRDWISTDKWTYFWVRLIPR